MNMLSIHKKIKLKYYIIKKRQEQKNQEEQETKRKLQLVKMRELKREIDYLERMICRLRNEKRLLLLKFQQVLNEEIEAERRCYIERMSTCLEDSTIENECAEVNTITYTDV